MNTVAIGNKFEDKSYRIIQRAVEKGDFSINSQHANIFKKKKYFSASGNLGYVFDISIEVKHPDAERYTMLWLIECKSYSTKKVPVDDIIEFVGKVDAIKGKHTKSVMISNSGYSSGVNAYADENNVMLIDVSKDSLDYNFILHKQSRKSPSHKTEKNVGAIIKKVLCEYFSEGFEFLSYDMIEDKAEGIRNDLGLQNQIISYNDLARVIQEELNVKILFDDYPLKIKGFYRPDTREIGINNLQQNNSKSFILGHELGHFLLHSKLNLFKGTYNDYDDSQFNSWTQKHELKNLRHWIEWQANVFSAALLLPNELVRFEVYKYRSEELNIKRTPHLIFVDNQGENIDYFHKTLDHLSELFGVSKSIIEYRLNNLKILTDTRKGLEQEKYTFNQILESFIK